MPFLPIGECCLKGLVLPGEPRGTFEPISAKNPVGRYVATPSSGNLKAKDKAVVLFYDAFGLQIVSSPSFCSWKEYGQTDTCSPTRRSWLMRSPISWKSRSLYRTTSVSCMTVEFKLPIQDGCIDLRVNQTASPIPVHFLDPVVPSYPNEHKDRSWFSTITGWTYGIFRALPYLPGLRGTGTRAQQALDQLKSEGYTDFTGIG